MTSKTDSLLASVLLRGDEDPDPYAGYERLREAGPAVVGSSGTVVLTGWDDCTQALRDKRLGKADESLGFRLAPVPEDLQRRAMARFRRTMLFRNAPEHARLRRLVSDVFTAKHVADLEPQIALIVDRLLDAIEETRSVDAISELALPLPVAVIGALLGLLPEESAFAAPQVRALMAPLEPSADAATVLKAADAEDQLADLFHRFLDDRRGRPGDDLLSRLVSARDDDALDDEECVGTAMLLFAAGFETTTNLIGNGLHALFENPHAMSTLRSNPSLIDNAVEEMLRYDAPIQTDGRTALAPTEVGSIRISEGTVVLLLLGAANRDPSHFARPADFDIERTDAESLSFGAGAHYCLGAPLARLEARLLFPRLLERFPRLHPDGPGNWRPGLTFRGLSSLPVSID